MARMKEESIDQYLFRVSKGKDELFKNISSFVEEEIRSILLIKDRFQFCICGGSTPRGVYSLLSRSNLPWERVDVFLGDERCVSPYSKESNSLMVRNSLLLNSASSASFYQFFENEVLDEENFKQSFKNILSEKCIGSPPSFDLTLLGIGDDGHTASLFPFKENNIDDLILFSEGKGVRRVSLTPKVFNASKKIAFLVSGSSKKQAIKRLSNQKEPSDRTPAKLIKSKSKISVFCDEEAYNY